MTDFFTSPEDIKGWVRSQESADEAATKIMEITGRDDEQDIVDTCRSIFDQEDNGSADIASKSLFGVLAKHNVTSMRKEADRVEWADDSGEKQKWIDRLQESSDNVEELGRIWEEEVPESLKTDKDVRRAAHNYFAKMVGTANTEGNLEKTAQTMRTGLYNNMPLRTCPKLPVQTAGKRLISTYNCREHCLDSLVLDDDPDRVYCLEALWRRHVMDKFAREFKDKDGRWVGGYINERFQVFHDDGGNNMQLAHGERTRLPRPHQYSVERRLSEGRGEETFDVVAKSDKFVKLASADKHSEGDDAKIYRIFSDMIEMREAGLSDERILTKCSEHFEITIKSAARILKASSRQLNRYSGKVYAHTNTSNMQKTASTEPGIMPRTNLVSNKDVVVSFTKGKAVEMGNPQSVLKMETPVVMISDNNPDEGSKAIFEIVDGPDAGARFSLLDNTAARDVFMSTESFSEGMIQEGADELGLNDSKSEPEVVENNVEEGMNVSTPNAPEGGDGTASL
jgi:hypothetical protein